METNEKEYVTFTIDTSTGETVEMAVIEEFEFENKFYVAASLVIEDEIKEGIYLYKVKDSDEFSVEKLRNKFEYDKVSKAYLEMLDDKNE
ncbi:MAG: DUF1292 domain-containing protein [Lachnospiraceae bacterium]|nr:DUF1292 domain-containing protein [Lachnospiraceae bacterium]